MKYKVEDFSLDITQIEKIGKSTLMIRNIPNRYNKNTILRLFNKSHAGKFDFFYLPIDFTVNFYFLSFTFKEW